jgi:hypothetical protein
MAALSDHEPRRRVRHLAHCFLTGADELRNGITPTP